MNEDERELVRKEEKFRIVTLSFYGPSELALYKKNEEKKLIAAQVAALSPARAEEGDKASMHTMASSIKEKKSLKKVS